MFRSVPLLLLLTSCAYLLPATWRSFNADPDDAAPAITRTIDDQNLIISKYDEANRKITTTWTRLTTGIDASRERFLIRWVKEDGGLTIYVRHEAQERIDEQGRGSWGSLYHDSDKEKELMGHISKELANIVHGP